MERTLTRQISTLAVTLVIAFKYMGYTLLEETFLEIPDAVMSVLGGIEYSSTCRKIL